MFIGHFAIAYLVYYLYPNIPFWVALLGVSFPDLLWPIFVILGIEQVKIKSNSPLQKDLKFTHYPYSHSLVISTIIAFVFGGVLSFLLNNWAILILFPILSASHWVLDIIVHRKDLPVLGFSKKDFKVGLGLWNHGRAAFILEYVFYVTFTILFAPSGLIFLLFILGTIFHILNANSFLGLTKKNLFAKGKYTYPIITLLGFGLFIIIASL